MWFARERVRTQDWTWPTEAASKSAERLKDLLDGAFRDVSNEKGIVAGASYVLFFGGGGTLPPLAPLFWGRRETDLNWVLCACRRSLRMQVARRRAWPYSTPRRACSTPPSELLPLSSKAPAFLNERGGCDFCELKISPPCLQPRRFWVFHPAPKGDRVGPSPALFVCIR